LTSGYHVAFVIAAASMLAAVAVAALVLRPRPAPAHASAEARVERPLAAGLERVVVATPRDISWRN
jgi:hypothetical protein